VSGPINITSVGGVGLRSEYSAFQKHHHNGVRYYIDIEFGTERKRQRENMEEEIDTKNEKT